MKTTPLIAKLMFATLYLLLAIGGVYAVLHLPDEVSTIGGEAVKGSSDD